MTSEEYFQQRLNSEAWTDTAAEKKTAAQSQAERELEPYRDRTDSARFFYAVCEQAIWLLEAGTRAKLQQEGVKSAGLGRASETFDLKGRPAHISPAAWGYLKPQRRVGRLI